MEEEADVQTPLVPKGTKGRMQQLMLIYKKPDFLVTWIFPVFVFVSSCLLFTYRFMQWPSYCVIVAICFGFVGVVLLALRNRGHVWFPLGVTTLAAVAIGTLVGLFLYERYACFPEFYANSRTYTNVVPSESSGSVGDAGGITFSGQTFVDIEQSSGFIAETGYVYCAAPVRDTNDMTRIEFWAVGVDCCGSFGSFMCDQALDKNARAGIRIFDNSGWFMDSNFDYYVKARRKAEAAYSLVSVAAPMFVRWVSEDNLNMLSNYYRTQAALAASGFILLYILIAAALSFALYRPRPAKPKAQWSGFAGKVA